MPGGSKYPGPAAALEAYAAAVAASGAPIEVKGAKNPYTSRNGHMFSFITEDGMMALRLSDELGAEFTERYETGPVIQYGRTMRGYLAVPDHLLRQPDEIGEWIARSHEWVGTLPPKQPSARG